MPLLQTAYTHVYLGIVDDAFETLDIPVNRKEKDNSRLLTKKLARDSDQDAFGLLNDLDRREHGRTIRQDDDSEAEDELEGWDEETTLVAMMQDRYVPENLTICAL